MLRPKIRNNISDGETIILQLHDEVIKYLEECNVSEGDIGSYYFDHKILQRIGDSNLFRVVDFKERLPDELKEVYREFLQDTLNRL